MPKRLISGIGELETLVGQEIACGDWFPITQERIDAFAKATDDYQWIHVDVERCKRESPFGTTIAHGFLTLSLLSQFSYASFEIQQAFQMTINYGLNKLRFMNPVRCGSRIRTRHRLLEVSAVKGGWQVRFEVTVDIEGQEKPALVAETLTRFYESAP